MTQRFAPPTLCSLLLLAGLAAGSAAGEFVQETPRPRTEVLTESEVQRRRLVAAYGGAEQLDALAGFRFRLTPSRFERQEDGTFIERLQPPFDVEVDYRDGHRAVRIEEMVDGEKVIRMVSEAGPRCFLGDKEVKLPEMLTVAREQGAMVLQYLDMYYGPPASRLPLRPDQRRTRDGVEYQCFESQTPNGDRVRHYMGLASHLIERSDLFDSEGMRARTLLYQQIEPVTYSANGATRSLPMPRQFTAIDRERTPQFAWRFGELAVNPEFPEGRFLAP